MDDIFIADWNDLQDEWKAGIFMITTQRPSLVALACRYYPSLPGPSRRALQHEIERFLWLDINEDALTPSLKKIRSWRPRAVEISW